MLPSIGLHRTEARFKNDDEPTGCVRSSLSVLTGLCVIV